VILESKPSSVNPPSISEIILNRINDRLLDQVDRLYCYGDSLEAELTKELDNGRLFRLLCKLGFINERPEYNGTPSWSEAGERYVAKMFRDYVFHQINEDGTPSIDNAHVVECLNKLDVGVDENILLSSRDERSMMVVSYKEAKNIISTCFNELLSLQITPLSAI